MNKKEITITTKKRLAKVFTYTGEQEQQLEFARQNLCKASAFEPYASFQRLDRLSKGYLTSRDLLNFMKENGIENVEETECKLTINFFDSSGEGRLMYTDYLQMLLPCDQPYLRAAATQRPTYPVAANEYLPYDVERLLAKLVQKELKLSRESERLKQELAARYDYNLDHLYKEVDDWGYKSIDTANLKRFLVKTGVFPSDQLLIAIIRRFDLDADAKIKQAEFIEGLRPQVEFSKKAVKDAEKEKTFRDSRGFSASKSGNKSLLRSASKGRSAVKSRQNNELSKSRTLQSSNKKSRTQKTNEKSRVHNDEDDERQLLSRSQLDKKPLEESVRQNVSSPDRSITGNSRYRKEHSPLRTHFTASLQNDKLGQSVSPRGPNLQGSASRRDEGPLSRTLNQSQFRESQNQRSPDRDSKNGAGSSGQSGSIDPSLIYLLREYFKEILAIEGGLDQIKKELSLRSDFTLAGAFNIFTGYSQARISANDLLYGLERLGVVCDIADVRLIVDRYDADKDGRLGFWEFSNSLMPVDPIIRDDLERRKAQWDLGFETKELLRRTFRKIVDAESMVESLRQRISRETSVTLRKAFDSLDWLGRGFLTSSEFKRAFEWQQNMQSQIGSYSVQSFVRQDSVEMEAMIRRFNKDKLNGRVSLPEFLDELTPKCPEKPY